MAYETMSLHDWLDDLCVRFVINLPREELESVERICFQIEEAQWFYEDFIRSIDPTLPSMNLRTFSLCIFQHCPLLSQFSLNHHSAAFSEFLAYKTRVPVRGAILLNDAMDQVVLVKGWKKGANWSFPRGKINKDEADLDCAVREVYEETGLDVKAAGLLMSESETKYIDVPMREQNVRLYVFRGVSMDTHFEPRTRKEISKIDWYYLTDLPSFKKSKKAKDSMNEYVKKDSKFYMVAPFLGPLMKWINQQHRKDAARKAPKLNNQSLQIERGAETDLTAGEDEDGADIIAQDLQMNVDNAALITADKPMDNNMNRLLSQLRLSADGPETPPVPIAHRKIESPNSAADGLKRLLSVGKPTQEPDSDISDARNPKSDILLSMLQGNATMTTSVEATETRVLDAGSQQLISTITKNATNHIQPQNNAISHAEPRLELASMQNTLANRPVARTSFYQKQETQLPNARMTEKTEQNIQYNHPSQRLDQPYYLMNDSSLFQPSNPPINNLHKAPPASKLPPPKLNSHTMKLLNTLRQPTAKAFDDVYPTISKEKLIDNADTCHHPLPPNSNFRPELEPQMGSGPVLEASLPNSSHINTYNNRSVSEHLAAPQVDTSQRDKLISLLSASNTSSIPATSTKSHEKPAKNKSTSQHCSSPYGPSGPSHAVSAGKIPQDSPDIKLFPGQDDRIKTNSLALTPGNIPDATHRLRQISKRPQGPNYSNDSDNNDYHAKTHQPSPLRTSATWSSTHDSQQMSTTLPFELSGSHVESPKLIQNTTKAHPEPEIRQIHQKQDIPAQSNHIPFLDRRDQVTSEHKSNLLSLFSNSTPAAAGSTPPVRSEKFSRKTDKGQEELLRNSNPQTSSTAHYPMKQGGATSLYNTTRSPASPVDRKFLLAYLEGVAKGGK